MVKFSRTWKFYSMFLLKVFSNYGMFVLPDTLVVFSYWSMCYSKIIWKRWWHAIIQRVVNIHSSLRRLNYKICSSGWPTSFDSWNRIGIEISSPLLDCLQDERESFLIASALWFSTDLTFDYRIGFAALITYLTMYKVNDFEISMSDLQVFYVKYLRALYMAKNSFV